MIRPQQASLLFCLFASVSFAGLALVEVHIDNPIDGDETVEIQNFLKVAISTEREKEWATEAKKELASLERYSSIECSTLNANLSCHLRRYPMVRNINFSGVPVLILEKELKKHIPIRTGQFVNTDDPKFNDSLKRSENAIKSFLERQGFFGSRIKTTFSEVPGAPASDIQFDVESGSFVKVRNVTLNNQIPIDPELVLGPFRQMCKGIRYAFEGIFQGTKACYNKDIERENIAEIEESLAYIGYDKAHIGYPEAHLTVDRHLIEDANGVPKYVDLKVNVLLGTRLEYDFDFVNAQYLDISDFVSFFRFIFAVEFISRAFNTPSAKAIYPEDQTILYRQLQDALTFKESHIVDDGQIQASISALKESLRSRGYASPSIEIGHQEKLKDNGLSIRFKITPGEPTAIRNIKIIGSDLFSYAQASDSDDFLITPRSAFSTGHFTDASLENDTQLVRRFFIKQGFASAQVKAVLEQTTDGVELIYNVDSGPRKLVHIITFNNDDQELTAQYLTKFAACKNSKLARIGESSVLSCDPFPLVESDLENESLKLLSIYTRSGYLRANPTYKIKEEEAGISVEFDFLPGEMKRAKVAELLVDGNTLTYRSVLERELGTRNIRPGAAYIPFSLDSGLRRLRSYNAFSKLTLEPIPKADNPDDFYLFLALVEKPTLALDLNFAFDSDRLFSVTLSLEDRNLFGSLLQLDTGLQFGFFIGRESRFQNTLTWPHVLGLPMDIKLDAPEFLYEELNASATNVNRRHLQSSTSLGFEWQFLEILRPSFEFLFRADQWEYETTAPFADESFFRDPAASLISLDGLVDVLKEKATLRAVLKPSLSLISLDNLFDPKFGYKVKGGLEVSGQGLSSDKPYTIFNFEGAGYASIGNVTFAANLRVRRGMIENPRSNWWVLEEEGDFRLLGGVYGPRSYDRDTLGIFGDLISDGKPVMENGIQKKGLHTGDFMLFSSAEVRFPLIAKLPLGKLNGAVFTDVGYIGICDTAFACFTTEPGQNNPHQLGVSVGVSLRWVLDVGPFSIDYAVSPIHKTPGGLFGRESRVNFQFGYIF
jgi:outer membrane protein assembly factor BamA